MKKKFLSVEDEPALRGPQIGPPKLDPSEEKIAHREARRLAVRGAPKVAEIDAVRDDVINEPALQSTAGQGDDRRFASWLEKKRGGVNRAAVIRVTLLAALLTAPFAVVAIFIKGGHFSPILAITYAFLFGPLTEEFLKQSGMIYLLERKPWMCRYAWQFPLAGLVAGAGFGVMENLIYWKVYSVDLSPHARDALMAFRWPVCTGLHMVCSLVASLGLVKVWKNQIADGQPARLSLWLPMFISAVVLHGLYNLSAAFLIRGPWDE